MDRPLFFLDGITFQKAGELFFETEETWAEQQTCPVSYRRSLEDFAEALLFGKGVAVGRDLPEVAAGVLPGDYLRSYIGELARPIDNAGQGGKPDDLLSNRKEKPKVLNLICHLADIVRSPDFVFWEELAIRESRHVGRDSSIQRRQDNPDAYKYKKRFCQDPQLRGAVPKDYLEPIIACVRNTEAVDSSVDADALRTYFAENAVTHILTFQWYRNVIPSALNDPISWYQPHATRSALIPPCREDYKVELPAVLGPMLQKADRPIDVLDELLCAALARHHRELGESLGEVHDYGARGQREKAVRAAGEEILLARRTEKTTVFRLSFSPPSLEFKSTEVIEEQRQAFAAEPGAPIFSPQTSQVISVTDYERELIRLFGPRPKLFIPVPSSYGSAATQAGRAVDRKIWYEDLAHRFGHYWKPPNREKIESFVDQFPPELRDRVLRMLRSVRLYSDGDFDFYYRRFFGRNRDLFNERTVICPLDMSGGSAFLMEYMSAHSLGSVKHVASLHQALDLRRDGQADQIVLLDDAAISGTQATHIIDEYLGVEGRNPKHVARLSEEQKELLMQGKVWLLFLFATDSRKAQLTGELRNSHPGLNVQVERIAQIDSRALFRDQTYIFGPVAEEASNFFAKVGYAILENRAAEEKETAQDRKPYRRKNAIGFGDDQLLVIYSYNVPKATVTLLWEHGMFEGVPWTPLFPIRQPQ